MRWSVCTILGLLACGPGKKDPDEGPFGLTERVDNVSCVIETYDANDVLTLAPTLSASGCYSDLTAHTPSPGLIPFELTSPLWSDGEHKQRFFGIPPGSSIGFVEDDAWDLPIGTVVMKEFWLETTVGDASSRRLIETRFFVRREQNWRGYTYQWNDEGTDGVLLEGQVTVTYTVDDGGAPADHVHDFPSRSTCLRCHPPAAGSVLGLKTPLMNRDMDYAGVVDNQIRAIAHAGYFSGPLPKKPSALPRMPSPTDPDASLTERARAYLHSNCAHCHQPDGSAVSASLDLRYQTPLADTAMCNALTPGVPAVSALWQQIDEGLMPPVATHKRNPDAELIRDWIASLKSCP